MEVLSKKDQYTAKSSEEGSTGGDGREGLEASSKEQVRDKSFTKEDHSDSEVQDEDHPVSVAPQNIEVKEDNNSGEGDKDWEDKAYTEEDEKILSSFP